MVFTASFAAQKCTFLMEKNRGDADAKSAGSTEFREVEISSRSEALLLEDPQV